FVPMIIAPVVAAAVWRWLLDPGHGMVNQAITGLGGEPVRFLADPSIAIWTIIVLTGWKLIGFSTLILSAANANINPSLVEAARMDGASKWEIIRDIRLPLLISDRKSTRLNSSHVKISYAVFCLKKKKRKIRMIIQR